MSSPVAVAGRVRICGVEFDDLDTGGVIASVGQGLASGRGGWIVTPNVDIVRQLARNPSLAALVGKASLVIVDGAPVQWAGRIAGHREVHRVPGASLAVPLAALARTAEVPMLMLGGRPGAACKAADNLMASFPGLRVAAYCPAYGFENDCDQWDAVRDAVREVAGGIVVVGLGFPKQEHVMSALAEEFPGTWFLGLGGTIDFLAGQVPRAPQWVQEAGFEWMYRLAVEPKRLARRYLVDGLPFAAQMMVWAAKERSRTASVRRRQEGSPAVQRVDLDRRVVTLQTAIHGAEQVEVGFTEYLVETDVHVTISRRATSHMVPAPSITIPAQARSSALPPQDPPIAIPKQVQSSSLAEQADSATMTTRAGGRG